MPGEEQERFEDYLELERFISELSAGRVAHPPEALTPTQARIYRMAALFHSVSSEDAEPRPEFADELRARLEETLREAPAEPRPRRLPFLRRESQARAEKGAGRVSRRALLAGGATVAASVAAGAALGHVVEQVATHTPAPAANQPVTGSDAATALVPADVASTWLRVTSVASLGNKAVKFTTEGLVGYVVRNDDEDASPAERGKIIAMSASCTHMGCIVQWSGADRKFHCPCHGGVFSSYGSIDAGAGHMRYLKPLPRLDVKEENGEVYVRVPAPGTR